MQEKHLQLEVIYDKDKHVYVRREMPAKNVLFMTFCAGLIWLGLAGLWKYGFFGENMIILSMCYLALTLLFLFHSLKKTTFELKADKIFVSNVAVRHNDIQFRLEDIEYFTYGKSIYTQHNLNVKIRRSSDSFVLIHNAGRSMETDLLKDELNESLAHFQEVRINRIQNSQKKKCLIQ